MNGCINNTKTYFSLYIYINFQNFHKYEFDEVNHMHTEILQYFCDILIWLMPQKFICKKEKKTLCMFIQPKSDSLYFQEQNYILFVFYAFYPFSSYYIFWVYKNILVFYNLWLMKKIGWTTIIFFVTIFNRIIFKFLFLVATGPFVTMYGY